MRFATRFVSALATFIPTGIPPWMMRDGGSSVASLIARGRRETSW